MSSLLRWRAWWAWMPAACCLALAAGLAIQGRISVVAGVVLYAALLWTWEVAVMVWLRAGGTFVQWPVPLLGVRVLRALQYRHAIHRSLYDEWRQVPRALRGLFYGWMWHTPLLYVSDSAAAREVMSSPRFERSWWEMAALDVVGGGAILAPNAKAEHTRPLFARLFARPAVARLVPCIVRAGQQLLRQLSGSAGAPVDVQPLLADATFAVVLEKVVGPVDTLTARRCREAFATVLEDAQRRVLYPWPRMQFVYRWLQAAGVVPALTEGAQARRELHALVLAALRRTRESRAAEAEEEETVLAAMLTASDNPFMQSDSQLVEECVTLLFAGHESTTSMLVFALALLASHGDVQERARAEVLAQAGGPAAALSFEALERLTYVRACLKETLRLYPSAPLRGRTALEAMEVRAASGAHARVAAGDLACVSLFNCGRDEAAWGENCAVFDPERFLQGTPAAILSFGAGPRMCVGERMAYTEGAALLALILRTYRVRLSGPPPRDLMELTLRASPSAWVFDAL